MFTGIIEGLGRVFDINRDRKNLIIKMSSDFTSELTINDSVSHNGICLTITEINNNIYTICAIQETIQKTNIGQLKTGDLINLERSLAVGGRLDGHFVQGHVDTTVESLSILEKGGSWEFTFGVSKKHLKYIAPMGAIALNGVSLTISSINDEQKSFTVNIIPHTFNNTNFKLMKEGDFINVEFDIISKQIVRLSKN